MQVHGRICCALVAFATSAQPTSRAFADGSQAVLEFRYTPVARAQVALWVEDERGGYLATVALTEAVAYRGIGNRPGASQMNSGYRWPYGRREGALPIWAHRRAAAPGQQLFARVIYQSRKEGYASRWVFDHSPDAYYCLSSDSDASSRDELDAVSCASQFTSDKGRYMTAADAEMGYAEPWEALVDGVAVGGSRLLPLHSVYPPRMDVARCNDPGADCHDHPDVDSFARDARQVMPEIDAVTRATAPGDTPQRVLFSVPPSWAPGNYVAWIEVNVEGDYDERWNADTYPTPLLPEAEWDSYAFEYGYPYRGQPSIAYRVPFSVGAAQASFSTDMPAGRSSWDHASSEFGRLEPVSFASGDPTAIADQNGSGADRLRRDEHGRRFVVEVKLPGAEPLPDGTPQGGQPTAPDLQDAGVPAEPGSSLSVPGPVFGLALRTHSDVLRSHTWVSMRFEAARSERPLHAYEVRVASVPIVDEGSFIRNGRPAKSATDDREGATALMLPTDLPEGTPIEAAIGDLAAQTHYYVGVRAVDDLNRAGPIRVAEITTTEQTYATVTPCFVATAAYGSPLAGEVGALRRLRDRHLLAIAPGRALVAAYDLAGPPAARFIERTSSLRALVRVLLQPWVALAKRFS